MRKIVMTAVALALGASSFALAGTAAAAPQVAPNNAACGKNGPNLDSTTGHALTGAQIRNGSSTSCPAVGAAQTSDSLDYFCFTVGPDHTWTFVRDLRTGTIGWIRDDLLSGDGSSFFCGF